MGLVISSSFHIVLKKKILTVIGIFAGHGPGSQSEGKKKTCRKQRVLIPLQSNSQLGDPL